MRKLIHVLVLLAVVAAGSAFGQGRLADIQARGELRCGVNGPGGLAGFAIVDASGVYRGFDADFCRAIAAAVFGDANKVAFRPLSAQERFTAVQTGEVDVLIRNTTWTASRDSSVGLNFTAPTFYDGQGFMVRRDSGIRDLTDFEGRTVCVQTGTTTELNLADVMAALDVQYTAVTFENNAQLSAAYDDGQCDGWTTDKSGLVATQTTLRVPTDHVILAATISKEPLGPSVLHGDDQWYDVVKWVVFATFLAEEYGVTSQNVAEARLSSANPEVRRLLGADPAVVQGLGLSASAFYDMVEQVGNFAEIYDRNLGPATPFDIPRGINASWVDGGLLYAPPIR
jgi:general L-amino acid transport system substrate-binding protein